MRTLEIALAAPWPSSAARANSRYGLVVCASKRARQLLSGEELKELKSKSTKNVTNALEEIAEGKINYKISKADL